VKSETTTKKTTTTGKQINEQTQIATDVAESHNIVDKTKIDVETTTVNIHEETPQKPKVAYYYYILLIIAILAGLIGIFYIGRKFKLF
jgi:cobalamin biosynthesis Mg chelatase CobN